MANEEIQVGPIRVRFLLTGEETNGSAAIFELFVPASERLPAPTLRLRSGDGSP